MEISKGSEESRTRILPVGLWFLPGMFPGYFFIELRAPARSCWYLHVTILNLRQVSDEFLSQRDVVDVNLHDPNIGQHGTEARAYKRGQMTVVVVRSDIELKNLGQVANFL